MLQATSFGPLITSENVIFRIWAPSAKRVELLHHQTHEMRRSDDSWFKLTIPGARPGDRYRFRIDGETEVPDPASSYQPDDVHGPSEVIDQAYDWKTRGWIGRPWHECVFLEVPARCAQPRRSRMHEPRNGAPVRRAAGRGVAELLVSSEPCARRGPSLPEAAHE